MTCVIVKRFKSIRQILLVSGFLLVILMMLVQPVEAVIGENLQIVAGEPLTITALTTRYLTKTSRFVAEGNVVITYRASKLTADHVEFDQVTGEVIATGNVRYEEAGETVTAERIELEIDTERGKLYIAHIALQNDHYLTGKQIDKTGEDTYLINKGSYTACSGSSPAWLFRCSSAKINQGDYLQAWNTVGYIRGIPVIYFPYFIYPIKTQRQTGFLIPTIGTSESHGFTLGNSFFWAISPYQDATLTHTYYEKRGHQFDIEYRYLFSKDTEGTLTGKYIRDTLYNTENRRLEWNHRQQLPYKIIGRIDVNLTSNDEFDENFETRYEDRTQQYLSSDVSLTRNFSQHTIRLFVNRLDDLREETDQTGYQRFPQLEVTSQTQQLFGLPLYIGQATQIARLQVEGDDPETEEEDSRILLDFIRADFHPTLSLPVKLLGSALTITPKAEFRETYYTRDATTATDTGLDAEPVHREYYTFSVNANGPKFNRIFDFGVTHRLRKLKHLIEPTLTFYYNPAQQDLNLPKFDGVDTIGIGDDERSRSMAYGITQVLLGKQVTQTEWDKFQRDEIDAAAEDLPVEIKEWAKLALNQSYYFDVDDRHFSDISSTLTTEPFKDYKLTVNTRYDVYINTFVKTYITLQGKLGEPVNFSVTWNREATVDTENDEITEVNKSLNLSTQVRLFNRINLSYQGGFNIEDRTRIKDILEVRYEAQCWNIAGNFTQQLVKDERESSFYIRLSLKHIGEVFKYEQ